MFSHKQLIRLSGKKLILPFYHIVSDNNPTHIAHLYPHKSISSFRNDLDYLLKHFEPISLKELIEIKKNNLPLQKNCFHLTFDDGLSEFYHVVAPILLEKKIPATVFLNSNFIDNKALFFRYKASILADELTADNVLDFSYHQENELDELAKIFDIRWDDYLTSHQPYLTSVQIQELINQGFTFGAHSKNHPLYSELTLEEQLEQTLSSLEVISAQFKLDYNVFSFPFTDDKVKKSFFDAIANKTDLTFGSAGLKEDSVKTNLQRIPMETKFDAEVHIKTQYVAYLIKRLIGKWIIKRK